MWKFLILTLLVLIVLIDIEEIEGKKRKIKINIKIKRKSKGGSGGTEEGGDDSTVDNNSTSGNGTDDDPDDDNSTSAEPTPEAMKEGYNVTTKIAQDICFYEYLHIMPSLTAGKVAKFGPCHLNLNMQRLIDSWTKKNYSVNDWSFMKLNIATNYGNYIKYFLPPKYQDCADYLKEPMNDYPKTHPLMEEPAFKKSDDTPYLGWGTCMFFTLEEIHGASAIDVIKQKWTGSPTFGETALKRENENRARHGSPALTLDPKIAAEAQKLADEVVKDCKNYAALIKAHKSEMDGKPLGMSIYMFNIGQSNPVADGTLVANAMYEVGKDYPWPEFTGQGNDPGLAKWGQFSQSMWKASTSVGYGLGRLDTCNFSIFILKYLPRGNVPGQFKDNVLPAKT